jgi:hypothetical protein
MGSDGVDRQWPKALRQPDFPVVAGEEASRSARRSPRATSRGSADENARSLSRHPVGPRLRIRFPRKTRARDRSRKGRHILFRPRGVSELLCATRLPRGAQSAVSHRQASLYDRRKRARSLIYLAGSRLQMAADVPPTMRRTNDRGKYCHACPGSDRSLRESNEVTQRFRALVREKIGYSLPAPGLSVIFRSARSAEHKIKYLVRGFDVARKTSQRELRTWRLLRD